jgi:hypothetical protein
MEMRRLARIEDEFTDLPLSKQWKFNLRNRRLGLCWSCSGTPSQKLIKSTGEMKILTRCERCLGRARNKQRLRRERLRANGTIPPTTRGQKAPQLGLTSPNLKATRQRSRSRYFRIVGIRSIW